MHAAALHVAFPIKTYGNESGGAHQVGASDCPTASRPDCAALLAGSCLCSPDCDTSQHGIVLPHDQGCSGRPPLLLPPVPPVAPAFAASAGRCWSPACMLLDIVPDLCSGGKDSCYNMILCQQYGHEVSGAGGRDGVVLFSWTPAHCASPAPFGNAKNAADSSWRQVKTTASLMTRTSAAICACLCILPTPVGCCPCQPAAGQGRHR